MSRLWHTNWLTNRHGKVEQYSVWAESAIRAYSHSNHRALQSKSTTVGDYRRRPEPDRQKARCRAEPVRGRGTSSATEQVSADENLRRFIPSKSPLPSRSSLPWSRLSHNFFFLWPPSFCQPCPWSKLTFGELAIMVVAIGPLLIGLYCICIRKKQKTQLYKGRHF